MTSVNVTTQKNTVTVQEGDATIVTVTTQGAQGANGAGVTAGDKGSLTVAANLTDWTLNDSVVTSAKITDGAIVNADINASAGIQGTKISPDFGSQNITTTGNAVFGGNLTVSGTTTTIDTTTLTVEDKNIELGKVGSPTDITADGGGITLLGDTNHTFNWLNATDSWTSSEHIALPDNKKLQLGDSQDLQIYHDSSNSYLDNSTGLLFLRNTSTNGSQIQLLSNNSGVKIQGLAGEQSIVALGNGAVELYHDNVKKLETTSSGVTVSGNLFTGHITAAIDGNTSISLQDTGHGFPQSEMKLTNGGRDLNIVAPVDIRLFPQGGENGIVIEGNGSVELYHDNVKRFNTTGDAVDVHGHINLGANTDNKRLRFGINNDLQLYHDGSNSFIDNSFGSLYLRPKAGEDGIIVIPDDGVKLHHNGDLRLFTRSWGVAAYGTFQANNIEASSGYVWAKADNQPLKVGAGSDLSLLHDGTDSKITNITGNLLIEPKSGETGIKLTPDAGVELYHNNVKKCETSADGLDLPDNSKLQLGDSQDLQIFHDSSHSVIKDAGTGMLKILGSTIAIKTGNDNETMATFIPNGSVSLFFDNQKKIETTSSGVTVTGSVTTEDMNMSNLNGTANEVDNTKGSWSIQEGADNLFLINRVSGKKYKFNLTEIS